MNHNLLKKRFPPATYEDLIPKQNGFVFKFIKVENEFVHTFVEGEFIRKLNIAPEQVIGKTLHEFLPEANAEQKQQFYEEAWNGKMTNYESGIHGRSYIAALAPIIVNGKVIEVHGTAIDITEYRENAKKIQKLEKFSLIGELAAGIAHEIRNPLTSIAGFAQIIKETTQDKVTDQYLDIMLHEVNRISTIVNELMFIARPKENMEIKKVNIVSLVFQVLELIEPETILKDVHIDTRIESERVLLSYGDSCQLTQVLLNLLQNAIEASSETICILLKSEPDNHFSIEIRDDGIGMTLERQEHLFEPFYTTKEKGTGLGLMTCKRIVENHHGTIHVKSEAGAGTAVTVTLPAFCEKTVHILTNESTCFPKSK